jgi:hypothetical protein
LKHVFHLHSSLYLFPCIVISVGSFPPCLIK